MTLDLVIRGGEIVDGTGSSPFEADLGVADGRIAAIGRLPPMEGIETIDARGLTVAPGFIDIHSHSDFTLLVDPRAVSAISQGVTLEVIGNCGHGCAPIADPRLAREVIYGFRDDVPINWRSMGGYLDRLAEARPAVNVMALVPMGQLRLATLGLKPRPASPDERRKMKRLLRQGLEEGAFGYSTGLEYATEIGATEEEVTELCREVARVGGLYATHTRDRDAGAVDAVAEAVRTAEAAGARLQVSHITPRGGRRDAERAIALVDAARERGLDAAYDMHTRVFGTTYLKAVLPSWALEGGMVAVADRLRDPAERSRMKGHRNLITGLGDWDRVVLLDNPGLPDWSRRSIGDIARAADCEPLDAAYDILLAEVEQIHRPMVILHCYSEEDLRATYQHAACTVGSDATSLATDGLLADSVFHGAFTWAAWFYRRMVRETKTFSKAGGIRKLSGLPAERLGLGDRGVIRKGKRSDIAVFDAAAFGETGTTFEPNSVANGMRYVIVNGVISLRDGALTGDRGGEVLRSA